LGWPSLHFLGERPRLFAKPQDIRAFEAWLSGENVLPMPGEWSRLNCDDLLQVSGNYVHVPISLFK
jgi:hypothetical protein